MPGIHGNHIPELPLSQQPQANHGQARTEADAPVRADAGNGRPPAPPAATAEARATNEAAARLQSANESLASMQELAAQGHGFARPELDAGYLQQNVRDAEADLQEAISAEMDRAAAAAPGMDDAEAADVVLARFDDHPELAADVEAAIAGVLPARQASALVDGVEPGENAVHTVHALDEALAGAPEEVRALALADPRVQEWVEEAADLVTGPLSPYLDDPGQLGQRNYPEDMLSAIRGLQQAGNGLHPDLSAALARAALPAFEQVNEELFGGHGMFDGTSDRALAELVGIASHVSGAPGDQALVGRFIDLAGEHAQWGRVTDAIMAHGGLIPELATSIGPALFIELERRGIEVGQGSPVLASMEPIRSNVDMVMRGDAAELYELTEALMFAQEMRPLFNSDAAYQAALDELMTETLGADWQGQINAQQDVLAGHGSRLLNQLGQYMALPEGHGLRPEVDAFIGEMLNDPVAQAAISMALRQDPSLAQGHQGEAMLELFAIDGLDGNARMLAAEFGNLYIATHAGESISALDASDPATFEAADAQLAALDDPRLAAALGVEPGALTDSIAALREGLPGLGGDEAQRGAAQRTLNNALNDIPGFAADDPAGQIFRGLAVTASGSALINANGLSLDDPRVESLIDHAMDNLEFLKGANFSGKSLISVAVGLDLVSGNNFIGKYGLGNTLTGRLFAAVGIAGDSWNAYQAFQDGDAGRGALHVTAAGGAVAGIIGAGTWLGPVGWAVAAISYIGLGAMSRAEHNNRFETAEMRDFLAASGLSDTAAAELYNTTGSAVSPVPLLLEYGQHHGLDAQQTVAWLNSLSGDELSRLVRVTHASLDRMDDGQAVLPDTHDSDGATLEQLEMFGIHVLPLPDSWAQFDGAVTHFLQVQTPAEWAAG